MKKGIAGGSSSGGLTRRLRGGAGPLVVPGSLSDTGGGGQIVLGDSDVSESDGNLDDRATSPKSPTHRSVSFAPAVGAARASENGDSSYVQEVIDTT